MTLEYIAFVASDGQIGAIQSYASDAPEEDTVVTGLTIKYISSDDLVGIEGPDHFINRFVWKDSAWFDRGVTASDYYMWVDNAWAVNTNALIAEVRGLRTSQLGLSDWTQMVDAPLTDAKKAEWVTYRQTLRDIMANLPADLDDPADVVWPTAP